MSILYRNARYVLKAKSSIRLLPPVQVDLYKQKERKQRSEEINETRNQSKTVCVHSKS